MVYAVPLLPWLRILEWVTGFYGFDYTAQPILKEQGITTGPISVYSRRINANEEDVNEANGNEQGEENDNEEVGRGPSTSQVQSAGPSQQKRRVSKRYLAV